MYSLTIFTPTYNRKNLLEQCYKSLKNQTNRNFIWLIIDDGSDDDTQKTVKSWIDENEIAIEYHYQTNKGKAFAINESIKYCKTDLWLCLDSDDCLTNNAVDIIYLEYSKAKKNNMCCGIIGNRFDLDTKMPIGMSGSGYLKRAMPSDVEYADYEQIMYKYKIRADKAYVFFTEYLKKYKMPIFDQEKFVGESVLYEQIGRDYLFYISREIIYLCKYRDDGLTANCWELHINSPKGYKYLKQIAMIRTRHPIFKYKNAISYVVGCILCGDNNIVRKSPKPIITAFAFFPGLLLYLYRYLPIIRRGKG